MPDLNEAELQKGQGFEFVVPSSEIGARSTAENNHRLEVKSSYEAMSNNLRANLLVAVAELHRGIRQQLPESIVSNARANMEWTLAPAVTDLLVEVGDYVNPDEVSEIINEHLKKVPVETSPHSQAIALLYRAYDSVILDSPDEAFNHDKVDAMLVALLTVDALNESTSRGDINVRLAIKNRRNISEGADAETLAALIKLMEELNTVPPEVDLFDLNRNSNAFDHAKRLAPLIDSVVEVAQGMIGGVEPEPASYLEAVKSGGKPVMTSGIDVISYRLLEDVKGQEGLSDDVEENEMLERGRKTAQKTKGAAIPSDASGMITRARARSEEKTAREIRTRQANLDLAEAEQRDEEAVGRPLRQRQIEIDALRAEAQFTNPVTGGKQSTVEHYGHDIVQGTGESPAAKQKAAGEGAIERAKVELAGLIAERGKEAEAARQRRQEESNEALKLYLELKRKGKL
ncbi:hypothetical protein A3F07_01295 [candidate division WWE3 bacterium RIFCSPHIGHO2_12_FULL_38_15]|uniref:Uncharacterized protein n=1 Tax=candidate division WWE3 bacterium RIFCSPHIGHO2_02_FULL_38_14 TaxID=1802620 RepID=A0A1F4V940_UNCKA|nr:MAG: hypothetical protein A2793_02000 [candidate division WWE3 bacterium RIFCSPHIGHO2_01_FULL_38_45]OGC48343.1 MAG: hypothetical protein A3F07_01295 [candidate division WWE3 bacterium RIFCSPHIGHO2_12_FULL_38_15]OGC53679.1 MAG: hypothetical protein A3D91_04555 [candidate division WWE3 bacterium RIFCSPHIGHO2_02_FULL_38_14]